MVLYGMLYGRDFNNDFGHSRIEGEEGVIPSNADMQICEPGDSNRNLQIGKFSQI